MDLETPESTERTERGIARVALIVLHGFVAVTALGGGTALVAGAVDARLATVLTPPLAYLDGSPFSSYLVPGFLLGGVIGGTHLVAAGAQLMRSPYALAWSAAGAFGILIWIFVQMVYIPFSLLQLAYFAIGIAQCGLVMLALGLIDQARGQGARGHS
ncbi:MAG: hypothetical protein ACTHMQ_07035 [Protaetiibacter sp.]